MQKLFIPVILGTAREGRQSDKVARFLLEQFKLSDQVETELVDVKDHLFGHTHPSWEEFEITKPWKELASRMDGAVFVVPEYNHSFPGELKIMLDSALEEYKDKPVILAGVSSGMFGGARGLVDFTYYATRLGFRPLSGGDFLNFAKVGESFNEDGSIANEYIEKKVPELRDILIKQAEVLRALRN